MRELRQHASRYLARVVTGESIRITDRGRPVALLVPDQAGAWEELVASGQVALAEEQGDLLDEEPEDYGFSASAHLVALRASER